MVCMINILYGGLCRLICTGSGGNLRTARAPTDFSWVIGSRQARIRLKVSFSAFAPRRLTHIESEYPYTKYNVSGPGYNYTDEEYAQWLQGECPALHVCSGAQSCVIDPRWTREETDYLFKLVNEWDSRWYLIVDRYDYPGGAERSMEVRREPTSA